MNFTKWFRFSLLASFLIVAVVWSSCTDYSKSPHEISAQSSVQGESETNAGIQENRRKVENGGCGGGFTVKEVTNSRDPSQVVLKKIAAIEKVLDANFSAQTRHQIRFIALTFPGRKDYRGLLDLKNYEAACGNPGLVSKNVKYLEPEMTGLLRMYISVLVDNELESLRVGRTIREKTDGNQRLLKLCPRLNCEFNELEKDTRSIFEVSSLADVKANYIHIDNLLFADILNRLRGFRDDQSEQRLSDFEIEGAILASSKAARRKIREMDSKPERFKKSD